MMKKLPVALLFLAIVIWSWKFNKSTTTQPAPTPTLKTIKANSVVERALNDISKDSVLQLKEDFRTNTFGKKVPKKKVSFWFSREVFTRMVDLVKAEGGDGIRLYYIDKFKKNEFDIAVVSTKYDNTIPSPYSKHKDYYEHNATDALFKMKGVKGAKGIGTCGGGAILYDTCDTCKERNCQGPLGGRLSRRDAENMVRNFAPTLSGKINTKSVWFDIRQLDSIGKLQFDGIRVYYGRYTAALANHANARGKQRDTFILMPTVEKSANQTTYQEDNFDCSILKHLLVNIYAKLDDPYNNGELCPDHCNVNDPDKLHKPSLKKK